MFRDLSFVFLLLVLIAEVLGTIGGFGSSVFFVPIANFYFDFHSVLGLIAIFHVSSNLSKIALFRKGLNKKIILYLGVPAIIFVIIGGMLTKYLDSTMLELGLAIFLIFLSLLFLIKKNLVIKPGKKESMIGGVLSGFSAGLLGTGGAIRGMTMAAFNLEKSAFIATSAFIDFAVDSMRTVIYFFNGYIKMEYMIYVPFLIVISWVGTLMGKKLLEYIPQDKFKRISLLMILAVGIITLVKIMRN